MSDIEQPGPAVASVKVKVKKDKKDKSEKKEKKDKGDKKEKKEKKEKKAKSATKTEDDITEDIPRASGSVQTMDVDPVVPETAKTEGGVDAEADVDSESKPKLKKRKRKEGEGEEGDLEIDVDAPTPLSKAQARAEKKKAKRDKKEGKVDGGDVAEDDAAEGGEAGTGAPVKKKAKKEKKEDEVPKRRNSIWIGNLSFKATPQSLKAWFEGRLALGKDVEVDENSVTRVNLPMKEGRNRWGHQECKGFAYVDFATPELQRKAVGLSETLLDGRKVLIKMGDDFTAQPDARTPKPLSVPAGAIPKNQLHKESSSLFMGNLPFDATEEEIRDFVEGNVKQHTKETRGVKGDDDESGSDDEDEDSDEEDKSDVEGSGSDDESGSDDDEGEGGKKPVNTIPTSACGLKKVRMPTFEDSGKCKGFAFIDFNSPKEATYALAVRANRFFRGSRKLNLQYASENATSRSMSRNKRLGIDDSAPPASRGPPGGRPARYFDRSASGEGAEMPSQAQDGGEEAPRKSTSMIGKKWEVAGRPRPGAALAMAKRENVSIVESQGKKITF